VKILAKEVGIHGEIKQTKKGEAHRRRCLIPTAGADLAGVDASMEAKRIDAGGVLRAARSVACVLSRVAVGVETPGSPGAAPSVRREGWDPIRPGRGSAGRGAGERGGIGVVAGGHRLGGRAAIVYTLIGACKRHSVDPFAYLRDVLSRLPSHCIQNLAALFPQNWKASQDAPAATSPV
jgi:hypothetical protein